MTACFFIVLETCFQYDKDAPRRSHCGGMEECRLRDPPQAENPASQDSFLCYRAGQSVMVSAGETFIGSCRVDKDGIFQTGMVYSTQQNKVRNRIGTGGVKISRNHNRAGILESCIK